MPTNRRIHRHRGGRVFAREKQRMHQLFGYDCWWCGHGGADTADHLIPLKYWPDQPVRAELMRPAHGVQGCPLCPPKPDGRPARCNQDRGAQPLDQGMRTSETWQAQHSESPRRRGTRARGHTQSPTPGAMPHSEDW